MTVTMTKAARAVIKAVGPTDPTQKAEDGDGSGLAPGEFKALVSAFGNVDSYGDVVMEGAFSDVLDALKASGNPLPVVWSHMWADVFAHIGHVDPGKAVETADGLEVIGKLDVDSPIPDAAAVAQQVHRLLAQKRISQFSFAFDVGDAGWGVRGEGDDEREVFELRKFSALHEVGPCLVGVNRETRLDDVKALRAAYPRPNRKADEPGTDPAPTDTPPSTADDGATDDTDTGSGDAPADTGTKASLDPRSAALLADIAATV